MIVSAHTKRSRPKLRRTLIIERVYEFDPERCAAALLRVLTTPATPGDSARNLAGGAVPDSPVNKRAAAEDQSASGREERDASAPPSD